MNKWMAKETIQFLNVFYRPVHNLEKGTEETADHSDSLGNCEKSAVFQPCGPVSSASKFKLYFICLHFQELQKNRSLDNLLSKL